MPALTATIHDTVKETNKLGARLRWAGTNTGEFLGTPPSHSYVEVATRVGTRGRFDGRPNFGSGILTAESDKDDLIED